MKYAIIALALMISTVAFGQGRWDDDGGRMFMGRGHGRMIEKLDLSDDQEKQFNDLSSEMQKRQVDVRSKMQKAQIELRDILREDAPDRGKVEAKQRDLHGYRGDMMANRTAFWFDVNKILTPDQQKTWKDHLTQMMAGDGPMKEKMQRRMHDGMGRQGRMHMRMH